MQPKIRNIKIRRRRARPFRGLCLTDSVPGGYFADAENLSSRGYPVSLTRAERGVINDCGGISAMYGHGQMLWLWETSLYFGSSLVGEVTSGEKQFASLGAYVVIYPDKKILNTDTLELIDMENRVAVSGASISPCNADGSAAEQTTFAKISASGIGAGFSAGDGVEISGLSVSGLDGIYLLQTVEKDFIVIIASLDSSSEETGEITVSRAAPDLDFICSVGNRVWGCSSAAHEIRACRLGDPKNWNVFQGVSTDSYAASVPTPGDFTGCITFLGNALFFKEDEILKLFGSKPSNFELVSSRMPGVEKGSGASLAITNSILFYKGLAGVYAYDGAVPVLISEMLGDGRYRAARAGALNGLYYVSMLDERAGAYALFVYDSHQSAWQKETGGEIRFFVRAGNELYMAGRDGKMYSVNGSGLWYDPSKVVSTHMFLKESLIPWHAETGPIALCAPDRQYASRIFLRYSLGEYASFSLYARYAAEEEYALVSSFSGKAADASVPIRVNARRSGFVQLRLEGEGKFVLRELVIAYETGGEG